MSKKSPVFSSFYCTKCGKKVIELPRTRARECGHLKKLFCWFCNEKVNCVEIAPNHSDYTFKEFQLELRSGNFDKEGNRKEPYRILRGRLFNERSELYEEIFESNGRYSW